GLKMALEQAGYQAGGKKLELIDEDNEGNPATAQAKYRKLVSQDKIHVLAGVLLSNIGYALVPPIERDRLPSLFLTTPDDVTKRKPGKYVLRSHFAESQPVHALGHYAETPLKYKRVAAGAVGMGDAAIGHAGAASWAPTLSNPANRTFMTLAEEKLKRTPSYFHAVMYSTGRWIIDAVKALDGNVDDRDKFLAALRKASET